ncbi:MAG: chemotaxis response regulator protein-glutamate methylesterase [Chloroflexi bacterium]|nr:MAG: hypothetical protein B6I35_02335 [Anaerolineaceae bacterium 4572_32.2]RLC81757.1 MAG: chemotaxis response regulator protein-glutamate methylesterase [Chloroflexota bacterium]RLC87482.1 MAG: chemotaxis response regulator protein-glutamate methylesterase [Chloroflexota bacterium]HEY74466.1 chemotaxis-specific protein-glutamate methyltransferase CheB [Thermoflexia bacterium]
MKNIIRVLVVEDSPTVQAILVSMLQDTPGFEVVGRAQNGQDAVRLTARLRPDVITMDIRMPRMNGLEATRQIMSTTPTPIVVITSAVYDKDLNVAFNAIAAGALTVVEKPKGLGPEAYEAVRDQLVTTIRLMSDVQVVTLWPSRQRPAPSPSPQADVELIAIASSTGGPGVLREILSALPGDMSIPIAVVQHITSGFARGFAQWLDSTTELQVAIAQDNKPLTPGRALIAPDDTHVTIRRGGIVCLDHSPPVKGLRPSATLLFDSVAETYGAAAAGVVLTGMGQDGADGLEKLKQAGGRVIAQDEASCVVFGMPKAAIERGVTDHVLPPDKIASVLNHLNELHKR